MTDFIDAFLATDEGPISREVTWNGVTQTVFYRRITAGQRAQLLEGQKISRDAKDATHFEVALDGAEINRHKMVHFAVVTADGKQRFKTLREVQSLPGSLVLALATPAEEINRDDDAAGK